MGVFIGLDVSLSKTAVCVVDRDRGVRSARHRASTGGARPRRTPGTVKSVTILVAPG